MKGSAEYARGIVAGLLEQFVEVEEKFQSVGGLTTEQEIIDNMRKQYSNNHQAVLDMVTSHQGLDLKVELVKRIFTKLVMPAPVPYRPLLRRLAALSSKGCSEVALRAQQLLVSVQANLHHITLCFSSGFAWVCFEGKDRHAVGWEAWHGRDAVKDGTVCMASAGHWYMLVSKFCALPPAIIAHPIFLCPVGGESSRRYAVCGRTCSFWAGDVLGR
jgi:hypothetical protein